MVEENSLSFPLDSLSLAYIFPHSRISYNSSLRHLLIVSLPLSTASPQRSGSPKRWEYVYVSDERWINVSRWERESCGKWVRKLVENRVKRKYVDWIEWAGFRQYSEVWQKYSRWPPVQIWQKSRQKKCGRDFAKVYFGKSREHEPIRTFCRSTFWNEKACEIENERYEVTVTSQFSRYNHSDDCFMCNSSSSSVWTQIYYTNLLNWECNQGLSITWRVWLKQESHILN